MALRMATNVCRNLTRSRGGRLPFSTAPTNRRAHEVSFDVTWTAVGPLMTEVNGPGSKRMERTATATGQVTIDGTVLVDGTANPPPGRSAPFIRVDTEK